jgi:uncharacterized protein YcfJ
MRTAFLKAMFLLCFACSAHAADAQSARGCSAVRSAIGAVIGGVLGTLVFPGVGTGVGVALGGGGMCGYDSVKSLMYTESDTALVSDIERTAARSEGR